MSNYKLFYLPYYCPYCTEVIAFINENKLNEIDLMDIGFEGNLKRLLKIGKRVQVPFLYNEGKNLKMYESKDIIDYLEKYKENFLSNLR